MIELDCVKNIVDINRPGNASETKPHMSNTLDQIPVDTTWNPTEPSRKMKPESQ